ncbi:hypothetical protein [Bacillus sp. FJAT-45037]|nr:hypothetical protein [Bacillus sp. FJAT-45037]
MSKHSRSKRATQQGKDAVQPANETEGLATLKTQSNTESKRQRRGDC